MAKKRKITVGVIVATFSIIVGFFAVKTSLLAEIIYPCIDKRINEMTKPMVFKIDHLYEFNEMKALKNSEDSELWEHSLKVVKRRNDH